MSLSVQFKCAVSNPLDVRVKLQIEYLAAPSFHKTHGAARCTAHNDVMTDIVRIEVRKYASTTAALAINVSPQYAANSAVTAICTTFLIHIHNLQIYHLIIICKIVLIMNENRVIYVQEFKHSQSKHTEAENFSSFFSM